MSMPWMPPKVIFLLFFDEASNVLLFCCGYHLHVKAKVQPLCSEDCCTFDLQEKTGILKLVLENNNNKKKTTNTITSTEQKCVLMLEQWRFVLDIKTLQSQIRKNNMTEPGQLQRLVRRVCVGNG